MFEALFKPQNIAVVGVSQDPAKLGSVIYHNILRTGFAGKLYPINPKYQELFGTKAFPTLVATGEPIDLVVISVPAATVAAVVRDAVTAKCKFAVIISAGFSELGEAGLAMEREVLQIAKGGNLRLLGPNCLGVIVPGSNLNASFAAETPQNGNIAFISQSGAFNSAMLDMAAVTRLGFSHFISIGNKADITEIEMLPELLADPSVKVIGMYLEEFSAGRQMVELIKANTRKPIVLLHPGKSAAARQAISSHTGSLAGSNAAVDAALNQAGVTRVNTIEDMFDALQYFSRGKIPAGKRTAIVTNAGGPGVILTDMLVENGFDLAEFAQTTQLEVRKVVPSTGGIHNPVDLLGDATAERYQQVIAALVADAQVDNILVLLTPQLVTQVEETAKVVIGHAQQSAKPIIPIFMGGRFVSSGLDRMYEQNILAFSSAEQAIGSLKIAYDYTQYKPSVSNINVSVVSDAGKIDIKNFVTDQPYTLPYNMAQQIALQVGLDMPKEQIVSHLDEAIMFKHLHPSVVLKALSEDVFHKSDQQLVYADLRDDSALQQAFDALKAKLTQITGKLNPQILIQEFIGTGEELILGVNRDGGANVYSQVTAGFGHLILVGKGGIYTEVYQDVSTGLVLLTEEQIIQMISKIKIYPILAGMRGKPKLAIEKIASTINSLQKLVLSYPEISSLDVNPVIVTNDRCVCVDLKIILQR